MIILIYLPEGGTLNVNTRTTPTETGVSITTVPSTVVVTRVTGLNVLLTTCRLRTNLEKNKQIDHIYCLVTYVASKPVTH